MENIKVREEGEPNLYTFLKDDNNWVMQIQMNGEYTTSQQKVMIDKILNAIKEAKYINGELGVIAIDVWGNKVYEDVVHKDGSMYKYYIQTPRVEGFYIVPERDDIPQESWGKQVSVRWIAWPVTK